MEDTARVALASPELETEWKISRIHREKIAKHLSSLGNNISLSLNRHGTGLYRGFIFMLGGKAYHVFGTLVSITIDGIIELKLDRSRKIEKAVCLSAPANLLPKVVEAEVLGINPMLRKINASK